MCKLEEGGSRNLRCWQVRQNTVNASWVKIFTGVSRLGWNQRWGQDTGQSSRFSQNSGVNSGLLVFVAWGPGNLRLWFNFSEPLANFLYIPWDFTKSSSLVADAWIWLPDCYFCQDISIYQPAYFYQGLEIGKWLLCENDSLNVSFQIKLKGSLFIFEGCFLKYSYPKLTKYKTCE